MRSRFTQGVKESSIRTERCFVIFFFSRSIFLFSRRKDRKSLRVYACVCVRVFVSMYEIIRASSNVELL